MRRKIDPDQKVTIKIGGKDRLEFKLKKVLVPPGKKISLKKDYDPDFTDGYKDKDAARDHVEENVNRLSDLQEKLYAQDSYSLLLVFQAMDAAGKDGTIRHVMSGVNPQGCHVTSFKAPSAEELDHDYLWRIAKALPARGMIGIFNRSHYEEVLVVRVHPEYLQGQKLPPEASGKDIWERRFDQINAFEKRLVENGTVILKFFLNVSKEEQKERFLDRINEPDKNWKFSIADYKERGFWEDYQSAIEDMLNNTSTPWAPWFVIPADHKWFMRLAVSETICRTLEGLDLKFPEVSKARKKELQEIKKLMEKEDD
ncbi:MAG: polyphosphate kinase 2 family protein [Candidatus Omnitrophica bacterium]|nr:polyphosphate kinase 2 family protein [Candidatus Omnitrophota bacterium]